MSATVLIASLVLGFGGSLHCLGMCGPLALSVPYNKSGPSKGLSLFCYYLAKALAYGSMGAVLGLFGKGIMLMNWQQGLSVVAGIFILLWACFPVLKPRSGSFLLQRQLADVYKKLQQKPKLWHYLIMGFLNGLLPCGLVYTALATASVTGSAAGGFTAMFLFGLGTAPMLIILVLLKNKISFRLKQKLKPLPVILSVAIGLLLILRGMNLGIPYTSPEFKDRQVKSCCAHH